MRNGRPAAGAPAAGASRHPRDLLQSIAYRMTGSVSESEDIAQEALARLERARADGADIGDERAWLSAVATRLAIDHLRSARRRREQYVGPWLPEPLVADPEPEPGEHAEIADSLSQAFMVVLETLSPVERAVFLLREVFAYDYEEIAAAVGKSAVACRQIASRARRHVDARRPRHATDPRHGRELLQRFLAACERGDVEALKEMLAEDAILYSDGGGVVAAARRPIAGADRVARFMAGVTRKRLRLGRFEVRPALVNGQPGRILLAPDGSVHDVLALDVAGGLIRAIMIVRNPQKLRHLPPRR